MQAYVKCLPGKAELDFDALQSTAASLVSTLNTDIPLNLPGDNQTAAIAANPKSAALYFDRVWELPQANSEKIPADISFFANSPLEIWMYLFLQLRKGGHLNQRIVPELKVDLDIDPEIVGPEVAKEKLSAAQHELSKAITLTHQLKVLIQSQSAFLDFGIDVFRQDLHPGAVFSDYLFKGFGIRAAPMFDSIPRLELEFEAGNNECVIMAMDQLKVVDEACLEWRQVSEFRKDAEAKRKFRRMRHWLDNEMVGKPISYVADEIAQRLEDYEWSIKKHAIGVVTGTISDLIDPRFVAAAGPVVGGLWLGGAGTGIAELAAGGLAIGRSMVSLATRFVDLKDRKRGQGSEVAFIHEIKKLAK